MDTHSNVGVRDLSKVVTLPSNNFEVIDSQVRCRENIHAYGV